MLKLEKSVNFGPPPHLPAVFRAEWWMPPLGEAYMLHFAAVPNMPFCFTVLTGDSCLCHYFSHRREILFCSYDYQKVNVQKNKIMGCML